MTEGYSQTRSPSYRSNFSQSSQPERSKRQQGIITELRRIQPNVPAGNVDAASRQRALLDEFLTVSKADAAASGRELGEDRRERREDMRRP